MKTTIESLKKAFRKAAGSALIAFSLAVSPKPKPAPRVSRFGTYYPQPYKEWSEVVQQHLAGMPIEQRSGPLAVSVEVVAEKPRTSKRTYPKGDCDNYLKSTCDNIVNANKLMIDDDQIVVMIVSKRFAQPGEHPHIHIEAFELEDK